MEFYQELLFTAILSVLLVSLLGKLFSFAAADEAERDREPTTKIAAENRGNDYLQSDKPLSVEVRSNLEQKCEEEIVIERFDGDLGKQGEIAEASEVKVREESEASISDYSARIIFELEAENAARIQCEEADVFLCKAIESGYDVELMKREIGYNSGRDMCDCTENEFVEGEEFLVELKEEIDEHRISTEAKVEKVTAVNVEGADVFLIKAIESSDNVVEVTKGEIEDNSVKDVCKGKENNELQVDLEKEVVAHGVDTEAKVQKTSAFVVKKNEEEDAVGLGEEYVLSEVSKGIDEAKEQSMLSEEDEWEGIERTELEKHFNEAAAYVDGKGGEFALSDISDDEQMKMYGLHKVVMEGPCYDPQPMALKVSARAKWEVL